MRNYFLHSVLEYDDVRRWVVQRQLQDINGSYLQNINYEYDGVGNIMRVAQSAPTYGNNLGGEYAVVYGYDEQNRLLNARQYNSEVGDYSYFMSYSPSGLVGTKVSPELNADMIFGYRYEGEIPLSHQPKMIYFPSYYEDMTLLGWNANGQMTSMLQPYQDRFRKHMWDEAGQLAVAIGNEYCGYYGYNANGERVYKLTGTVLADQYDAGDVNIETYFDDIVLYVNPYMVVTPRGYTKHYYNGSERIAARLGDYWMDGGTIVDESGMMYQAREVLEDRMSDLNGNEEYFENEAYRSIYGEDFCCESHILRINNINYNYAEDMLLDVFNGGIRQSDYMGGIAQGIFYYHTDHLGSASWITDDQGGVIQYIHYMPYGELWVNQQANSYDERFKFTGKERDTETGYDYFGARYYLSLLGIWMSPDPLANKYPNISPYAYCSWNPITRIDPDGRDVNVINNGDGTYTTYSGEINDDLNIYIVDNNGQRTGEVLGQTLTPYTFFGGNDQFIEGATINMHDYSGQEFLSHITIDDPNPVLYAIQALPYGDNDFKNNGYVDGMNKTQHHYRAMPINVFDGSGTKIATARDIGNYAAGFVAGSNGLSWGQTRTMFDRVQGNLISSRPEPKVSTSAQYTGYQWGYQILGQFRRYGNK